MKEESKTKVVAPGSTYRFPEMDPDLRAIQSISRPHRHIRLYSNPPLVASPYCSTGFLTAKRLPTIYLIDGGDYFTLKDKKELDKVIDPITILQQGEVDALTLTDRQRDSMSQLYKKVKEIFKGVNACITIPKSEIPRYIKCNIENMSHFALDYLVAQACGFKPDDFNPLVLIKGDKRIYVGDYPQIDAELYSPTRLWKDAGPLFDEFTILVESTLLNHAVVKNAQGEYYEDSFKRSHVDGDMTVSICKAVVSYFKDQTVGTPLVPNYFLDGFEGIGVETYIEQCNVTITDY